MKKIRNDATGETFVSVTAASKSLGVKPSAISHALAKRSKTCCGSTWSFVVVENTPAEVIREDLAVSNEQVG